MFGIGFWEIAVILAIALIALGPEKLPDIARKLGRGMRELREAANGVRRALDDETRDIRNDLKSNLDQIKQPFEQARKPLDDFQAELKRDVTSSMDPEGGDGPVTPKPEAEAEVNEGDEAAAEETVERDETPRGTKGEP